MGAASKFDEVRIIGKATQYKDKYYNLEHVFMIIKLKKKALVVQIKTVKFD